jgi:hypothetical protein
MAKKPEANAVYLKQKNGWFWVVPQGQGQRSIYYGPYASKHAAEFYHEDVDTYRYDGGLRPRGGIARMEKMLGELLGPGKRRR